MKEILLKMKSPKILRMVSRHSRSLILPACSAIPFVALCCAVYASPNWFTVFYSSSGHVRSHQIDLNSVNQLPNGLTSFQTRMEFVNPFNRSTFFNYSSTFIDCETGQLVSEDGRRTYPTESTFDGFDVFEMFCARKTSNESRSSDATEMPRQHQTGEAPKTEWFSVPSF